ncbi:MAG: GMC family oxidoreductase [Haliscomenobacteraceae bacterium CHB4]|nr:Fructose dehydrogenase large subunit [Saprospiraceae bacterium]MCE7925652.1 GMC family oxidoreductase [Haliscomenobacteraceae bacterium CHB4]
MAEKYDAIVVGSGIAGGWAAKELTEKGLKTIMLERGKDVKHVTDYPAATKKIWEFPHRGRLTNEMKATHPVQKRDYPYNEFTPDWWVNDLECPYTEVKRFDWYRGFHVGGKSLMWGRQSYRLSDFDFEANAKEGIAIDWPIRYKDIAPWYDYVETFAGISGSLDGLPQLPDGKFLPPMEMNIVEKEVAARIKAKWEHRRMIIGRVANLTQEHKGRGSCQYRNLCARGCPFGAYFSTQSATLPAAVATGNLTLRPFSIVNQILYDKDKKRAKGVLVIDAETLQTIEYEAKIIFVCGSTLGSTQLLLNSIEMGGLPDGIGNSSGQLGHNLMDHHFRCGAGGIVEGFEDKIPYGRRANGIYVPRFRNLFGDKRDYLRGFGYQGGANRQNWSREVAELSIGADFKNALCEPGQWSIGLGGFGEMLPYYENKVTLDKTKKDKWGQYVLAIDCELKENENKMRKDMMADAAEMLNAAGVKKVETYDRGSFPGMAIHEMGTMRMGNDPKTSVLNRWNQMHDVPNVFVTDGSCMTSIACVNPSLTFMALTARAADYAVGEMKKGNL